MKILHFKSTGQRILLQLKYLEQSSCHCLQRTTQQTFFTDFVSWQKKAKLYFPSRVRKQFKVSTFRFKPVLRHNCLEKVRTCPYTTLQCLPLLKRHHKCCLHGIGISSDCFFYLQVCWCWWCLTIVPLWPY